MATSDAFHGVIKQPVTTLINPAIMFTHTGMALVYTLPIHRFTFIMLALEFNWSYTRKANILNPSHCACFISAALQPCRAQHATLFWMHWTYKQLYRMMKALIRKCLCLSLCTLCCSQCKLREALKCHPVLSSRAFYLIHDSGGWGELGFAMRWRKGRKQEHWVKKCSMTNQGLCQLGHLAPSLWKLGQLMCTRESKMHGLLTIYSFIYWVNPGPSALIPRLKSQSADPWKFALVWWKQKNSEAPSILTWIRL